MIQKSDAAPEVKPVRELLDRYGLSLAALHRETHIPYRTLQNWANNVSDAPVWALFLIENFLENSAKNS